MTVWLRYKARFIFKICFVGQVLGLLACGNTKTEHPDLGLVKVDIAIDSDDLAELNAEVFLKKSVSCRLRLGHSTYQGRIRYAGQGSLDDFKKSFEISFGTGRYRGFSSLRLSGQSVDPSGLRSMLAASVMADAGVAVPFIEPVAVYLQGRYLGLYFLIEDVDREFFSRRNLPMVSLYKAYLSQGTFAPETAANLPATWNIQTAPAAAGDLRRLIAAIHDADPASGLTDLAEILDIEGYLRYLAAATYLNHSDGIVNNFILWRRTGSKQFEIVAWDFDRIYEREITSVHSLDDLLWRRSHLARKLLASPPHAARFREFLTELEKTVPLVEIQSRIDAQVAIIFDAFAKDPVLSSHSGGLAARREELIRAAEVWLLDLHRVFLPELFHN